MLMMIYANNILKFTSFDFNSLIISLISVIVGVILDRIWNYYDEKNKRAKEEEKREIEEKRLAEKEKNKREEKEKKRNEELNNIKNQIKTECELNVENLINYNEKYLKFKISTISPSEKRNEIYLNFYKNLDSFPIFSHETWDNSINDITDIFRDDEIKRIMEFNIKCDMLKEKSINFHEKSKNDEFARNILQDKYSDKINEARRDIMDFEWEINNLISDGKIILHFLNL